MDQPLINSSHALPEATRENNSCYFHFQKQGLPAAKKAGLSLVNCSRDIN